MDDTLDRINQYNALLNASYDAAIEILKFKYGEGIDDYYKEKSYKRFLKKEIKSITKGKYSRTSEGLYCHHIDENKYLNISNKDFIFRKKYPYDIQKKERLVYCDIFEHLILHALIAKETNGEFGVMGYVAYIYPMIVDWYIGQEKLFEKKWMITCYKRAYLEPEQTRELLSKIKLLLPEEYQTEGEIVYVTQEERLRIHEEQQKEFLERRAKLDKELEEWRIEENKRKEKEERQRVAEFYKKYPKFKEKNIDWDTSRSRIISLMYDLKYKDSYKTKKDFDKSLKPLIKDKLYDKLHEVL